MAGENTQGAGGTQDGAGAPGAGANQPASGAGGAGGAGAAPQTSGVLGGGAQPDPKAPAAGAKPGEPTQPAPLELKLPDGFDPKDPLLDKFKPLATELKLASADAQKLLDLHIAATEPIRAARAAFVAEQKEWTAALRADPDMGGAKYTENLAVAEKALARFGSPALAKLLATSGFNTNPEVVKAFWRIGNAIAEDTTAGARGNGTVIDKPPSNLTELAAKLYGPA